MIFAISDAVWLGIFGLIGLAIKEYLDYRRSVDAITKLDDVKEQVHVIEKATNSMKDALVLATEKEAFARGVKEEKNRSENAETEEAKQLRTNAAAALQRIAERQQGNNP